MKKLLSLFAVVFLTMSLSNAQDTTSKFSEFRKKYPEAQTTQRPIQSINIDAGFHLQSASREHFTGVYLCMVGVGISTLYALAPTPSKVGMTFGGGVCLVGIGFNVSSWIHIGKAGKIMQHQ